MAFNNGCSTEEVLYAVEAIHSDYVRLNLNSAQESRGITERYVHNIYWAYKL